MSGEAITKVSTERIGVKPKDKMAAAKQKNDQPVGIFDSGVGGLTVFSEFIRQLPREDVIYLADTKRVPYGSRPKEEIVKINEEILNYFSGRGVKLVIMACGTSSSIAYPVFKDKYDFPIISMIEPGAKEAAEATKNGKIGVIATIGTTNSGAFPKMIKEIKKGLEVFSEACPLFVPLIEGGFIEAEETKKVARQYLNPLLKHGIDTLVLGCTHYPHLKNILREIAGPDIALIDPSSEAVFEAKQLLSKSHLLKKEKAKYEFAVTDNPHRFSDLGSKLLGRPVAGVKLIEL